MGLDISHDAFSGAYSSFTRFRRELAKAAGGYELDDRYIVLTEPDTYEICYEGRWAAPPADPLLILFYHSDCEGEIVVDALPTLADRIESLIPLLPQDIPGARGMDIQMTAREFVAGCRAAIAQGQPLEFY